MIINKYCFISPIHSYKYKSILLKKYTSIMNLYYYYSYTIFTAKVELFQSKL